MMSIAERIKNIAIKAKVSYFTIKNMVYSIYGSYNEPNVEERLKLLEKEYNIKK